jgi:ATP-binding cassette subfamily G (WHITE) protein 2
LKGTIIFSIHQPRYSIFKLFDTLFLIAAGRCIYHGPATDVLPFFASVGFTCEEHDNPADFLLDVSQGEYQSNLPLTNEVNEIDSEEEQDQLIHYLNNAYEKTQFFAEIKQEASDTSSSSSRSSSVASNTIEVRKKSRLSEIFYVSQRTFRNAFRNPALVGLQTGISIFLGVLIGLIYLNTDQSIDIGLKNRIGAIFFIVTNQVFGSLSALDLFIKERPLFQHENVSGYYHVSTYFMSKLICDVLPLRTIPSILFSVIAYFMIGFQRTAAKYFIFFFGILSTTICASSLCFLVSASVQVFGNRSIVLKLTLFVFF